MKNRKMIMRLFLSYVILVIPMIGISFTATNHIIGNMKAQVDEKVKQECVAISQQLEMYMIDYKDKAVVLYANDKLDIEKMLANKYDTQRGMTYLSDVRMMDDLLNSLLLICDDLVYTEQGYCRLETWLSRTLSCNAYYTEIGTDFINQRDSNVLLLRTSERDFLVLHFCVDQKNSSNISMNFCIKMDDLYRTLFDSLSEEMPLGIHISFQSEWQNEDIYLSCIDEEIEKIDAAYYGSLTEERNWASETVESELLGLTIDVSYDSSVLYKQVNFFKKTNIVLSSVFLLLGMLASYYISRKHYLRVHHLKESLERVLEPNAAPAQDTGKNDFDTMQMMVKNIGLETTRMKKEAEDACKIMKKQVAMLLFCGGVSEEKNIVAMLENCGVELQEQYFSVACICFPSKNRSSWLEENRWINENLQCESTIEDTDVLIVLVELPNQDLLKNNRNLIAEKIVRNGDDEHIKVAFSQVYEKLSNAPKAYLEVIGICKQLLRSDKVNVGYMDLLEDSEEPNAQFEMGELERFEDDIMRKKWQNARNRLDVILEYIKNDDFSEESRKYLRYCVIQTVTLCVNASAEYQESEIMDLVTDWNVDDEQEFEQKTRDILNQMGTITQTQKQVQKVDFKKIVKYINANFHRYDLSLEEVAEFAGCSKVYLSKLFKQKTGSKYIDYLTKCRMEHAMKLLQESDLSIKAICEMVGYSNIPGFRKKFKEYYGVNASEYRKSLHGSHDEASDMENEDE